MSGKPRLDIYQSVTDHIVATIEALSDDDKVIMPWHRSGLSELPHNINSGNYYNGINILSLWMTAIERQYTSNVWGTYKQWAEQEAQVRKGEKSTLVIFYSEFVMENENGEDEARRFAKASWAFNAAQVDGYEVPIPEGVGDPIDRIEAVDTYVANTKAKLVHGREMACYSPNTDTISMPDDRAFIDTDTGNRSENYYAVLLHELTHWCGAEQRCNRDMGKQFGDNTYAMEELVAELGAAFQCAHLGISLEPRDDHAHYISHWMDVIKADKRAIFTAAAKASEAVQYIKALQ
jgi:antirestriction protein ArdC